MFGEATPAIISVNGDARNLTTLAPATHIFLFDLGFAKGESVEVETHSIIAPAFTECPTALYMVSFMPLVFLLSKGFKIRQTHQRMAHMFGKFLLYYCYKVHIS